MVTSGLAVVGVSAEYTSGVRGQHLEPVLHGISFEVQQAEIVALLGPSGCGKSTLLRVIAGLEPLTAGAVFWDAENQGQIPTHDRGFGMVFQDAQLFPQLSVAKNVGYGLRGAQWPKAARAAQVEKMLALVGLADAGERAVTQLSGGERQRVALARSLASQPRLLMLDEPLSALDRSLRDRLADDLAELLRVTRTTAILVTHDEMEAATIADRTLRMSAGRVVSG